MIRRVAARPRFAITGALRHTPLLAILPILVSSCARVSASRATSMPAALPAMPFVVDSVRSTIVERGVTHRFVYSSAGPWAIHVLEAELDRCVAARAINGGPGAAGRVKTSSLAQRFGGSERAIAAVNADFFALTPPVGVPSGAMIAAGRVVTGPTAQPVLMFDSAGRPHTGVLSARGVAAIGARRLPLSGWNRRVGNGIALFDSNWGASTDTATGLVEVALAGRHPSRVVRIDTGTAGVSIPSDGAVLVAGRNAAPELRRALVSLSVGDTLDVSIAMTPAVLEAVGGRPMLVQDSAIVAAVDTTGQPGFATSRHPRTAAGIARNGTRLLLVVVDGRQAPYSDGMTLRELAELMRALGARDAINLDGGGSSTLVVVPRDSAPRVMNRPSDPTGERPVGNALTLVSRCPTSR